MADASPMDNFEIHQENDFEKISAPGTGSGSDQEGDGLLPPADGPQVGEVSTTSDGHQGEIETDDDQFNMIGASDVEGFVADPLVSLDNPCQSQFQPDFGEEKNGNGAANSAAGDESKMVDLLAGAGEQSDMYIEKVADIREESKVVDLLVGGGGGEVPSHSQPDILDFDNENLLNSHDTNALDNDSLLQDSNIDTSQQQASNEVIENMLTQSHLEGSKTESKLDNMTEDNISSNDSISEIGIVSSCLSDKNKDLSELNKVDNFSAFEQISEPMAPTLEQDVIQPPESEIDSQLSEPESLAQSFEPEKNNILNEEVENVEPAVIVESSPAGSINPAPIIADVSNVFPNKSVSTDPTVGLIQRSDEQLDSKVDQLSEQSSQLSEETATEGNWLKGVDPRVVELIYWRDVKKTGIVFGVMLASLLSLAMFSLVSVLAYLSLALLTVSFSFVVYKKIMAAVQKSNDGHPFKCVLEMDLTLREDKLKSVIQALLQNLNKTVSELRRLFFIEDMVDSIKFGLLLWVSTYLGCCLNGITLVILAVIALFTVPKVYETYQVQIDNYVGLARAQINNVMTTVTNKLPFLKKKEKAN